MRTCGTGELFGRNEASTHGWGWCGNYPGRLLSRPPSEPEPGKWGYYKVIQIQKRHWYSQ